MVYLNLQNVDFLLKGFCILRSVTRIMVKTYNYAAVTGTCIFGDPATFINKDRRVLFGDIFIAPFLSSPGWGNLVAFDWNDLPVGRKFDGKFLKNVKSPRHPLPPPRPALH